MRPIGLFADQLRRMELWDIGVLLDGDLNDPAPRIVIPESAATSDRPKGPRLRTVD